MAKPKPFPRVFSGGIIQADDLFQIKIGLFIKAGRNPQIHFTAIHFLNFPRGFSFFVNLVILNPRVNKMVEHKSISFYKKMNPIRRSIPKQGVLLEFSCREAPLRPNPKKARPSGLAHRGEFERGERHSGRFSGEPRDSSPVEVAVLVFRKIAQIAENRKVHRASVLLERNNRRVSREAKRLAGVEKRRGIFARPEERLRFQSRTLPASCASTI